MAGKSNAGKAGNQGAQRPKSMNWLLVVVAIAIVATISFAMERQNAPRPAAAAANGIPVPVAQSVMDDLTTIPAPVWEQAGTANAAPPVFVGLADTTAGKPQVLYIGSLFCPYCAAARWSVIAALSRFGTFSGLSYSASSSSDVFPSTPTFSFHGGRYTSQYIDFESVELQGAELVGRQYPTLETPTDEQERLIRKYDGPPYLSANAAGGIPFMLVGGRYMWSGSPYNPGVLAGFTQATIAATLPTGTGNAAQAILANANEITATICAVDGQQPVSVCSSPAVQAAMKALPKKAP
jgi:hypothetical protein